MEMYIYRDYLRGWRHTEEKMVEYKCSEQRRMQCVCRWELIDCCWLRLLLINTFMPSSKLSRQIGVGYICIELNWINWHICMYMNGRGYMYMQVPPYGKGSLYIRPLLFGSGSVMGVLPAPQSTFLVYTNPIGNKYRVSMLCYFLHLFIHS